jgi:CBS domain containing-hemolysin-like protein
VIAWLASAGPLLLLMAALLFASALFSGSEAALFSLTPKDRRRLSESTGALRAANRLLEHPNRLLSSILFWNLLTNMTYFAIASTVGAKAGEIFGEAGTIAVAIVSLVLVIFFGEMLPKSIAVLAPFRIVGLIGWPMTLAVKLLAPLLPLTDFILIVSRRLLWPNFQPESYLQIDDIERAIQLSTGDTQLAAREKEMLRRCVELADVRADEWMRPRSRLRVLTIPLKRHELSGAPGGIVLAIDPQVSSEPTLAIDIQSARPSQLDDPQAAADPMLIVPWAASVAKVLDGLRAQNRQIAAVINEYGEFMGILTLDDILEGIFREHPGRPQKLEGRPGMAKLDSDRWEVSGLMGLRRLAKSLDVSPPAGPYVTVLGFIDDQLGRIARVGDTVRWEALQFTVIKRRKAGHSSILIQRVTKEDREEASS